MPSVVRTSKRVLSLGRPFSPEAQRQLDNLGDAGVDLVSVPEHLEDRADVLEWIRETNKQGANYEGFIFWISHVFKIIPTDSSLIEPFLPPYTEPGTFKLMCGPGAGFDKAPLSILTENEAFYANTPEAVAEPTAAHTVILVLTVLRGTTAAERSLRRGEWTHGGSSIANRTMGRSQVGLRLGIVGMGSIGRIVARYLSAMGMIVSYHNRNRLPEDQEAGAVYVATLDELLANTDVLSINVPLNSKTKGLIGARELALLPEDAVVINVSRGPVVDEQALIEALKSGKLGGAGLDVFNVETSDGIDPWLKESDKVVLTPHFACNLHTTMPTLELEMLENVRSWARDGKPRNAVNGW